MSMPRSPRGRVALTLVALALLPGIVVAACTTDAPLPPVDVRVGESISPTDSAAHVEHVTDEQGQSGDTFGAPDLTARDAILDTPPPDSGADAPPAPLLVFPGAEGFGTATQAGRGGTLWRVTTLAASGPGSLRAALEASGPRTVVFDISGTIQLTAEIAIDQPFITVAGQTAPSPGITLRGAGIAVRTHDVLIQHLRVRVGDDPGGPVGDARDGVAVLGPNAANVVIDHVSTSWAVDENASTWYPLHDVTFSACIISEGLHDSIHPEGPHSKGLLLGDSATNVALIGSLLAHNVDRNPFIKGGTHALVLNNVLYNWVDPVFATSVGSSDSTAAGPALAAVVGNVYLRGPNTPLWGAAIGVNFGTAAGTQLYRTDNLAVGLIPLLDLSLVNPLVSAPPAWTQPLTVRPASDVTARVLAHAGARPKDRDAVDQRIVAEVQSGTGKIINHPSDVGGWPDLAVNSQPFAVPADPSGDDDGDGYTNLEEALHTAAAALEGP